MRVDLSLLFPLQWCCDKPDGVVVWPRFYMNCPDVVDSDTCQVALSESYPETQWSSQVVLCVFLSDFSVGLMSSLVK